MVMPFCPRRGNTVAIFYMRVVVFIDKLFWENHLGLYLALEDLALGLLDHLALEDLSNITYQIQGLLLKTVKAY